MASVEAGKENGACAVLFALISLDLWSSLSWGWDGAGLGEEPGETTNPHGELEEFGLC